MTPCWPLRILVAALLASIGSTGLLMPGAAAAQSDALCFRETNRCLSGRFRQYWEQNGGLSVFGFPITADRPELNRDTGRVYLTQWFERARFEWHPDKPAEFTVLLGLLGHEVGPAAVVAQVQPVKGNIASRGEKIYHVPGGASYSRVIPEACFSTEEDAQATGYRRAQR